jgi:hypothetical protein
MATFVISGLWHGANWTFVVWGTLHGALQCMEKALGWNKKHWKSSQKIFHWLFSFILICLAWIFFRANTISDAFLIIKGVCTNFAIPYMSLSNFFIIGLALLVVFVKEVKDEYQFKIRISDSPCWIVRHLYIVFMIAFIILFGVLNADQFIYFQF